ncbi:MAG: hypothetical protein ACU85U_19655 [Gammaproteobacteria bacterium]
MALGGLLVLLTALAGCSPEATAPVETVPRGKNHLVGKEATGQSRRISGKLVAAERAPLSFRVQGVRSLEIAYKGSGPLKLRDWPAAMAVRFSKGPEPKDSPAAGTLLTLGFVLVLYKLLFARRSTAGAPTLTRGPRISRDLTP